MKFEFLFDKVSCFYQLRMGESEIGDEKTLLCLICLHFCDWRWKFMRERCDFEVLFP